MNNVFTGILEINLSKQLDFPLPAIWNPVNWYPLSLFNWDYHHAKFEASHFHTMTATNKAIFYIAPTHCSSISNTNSNHALLSILWPSSNSNLILTAGFVNYNSTRFPLQQCTFRHTSADNGCVPCLCDVARSTFSVYLGTLWARLVMTGGPPESVWFPR